MEYAKQWGLGNEFKSWVENCNIFCSTLVDRIVTGYPGSEAESLCQENGYRDNLLDTCEIFGFWVIEGPEELKKELPFAQAGLPVLITNDHKPYKQRKVRILNGAHTAFVPGAFLAGQNIVRDCMHDNVIRSFMEEAIYNEIIPTLTLPETELKEFAASVTERFKNPFIDHSLLSITLNSTSKWKARVLPSLKGYVEKYGCLPKCLTASFAFYLAFYRGTHMAHGALTGFRGEEPYTIWDDGAVLEFFYRRRNDEPAELVHAVCSNTGFWGEDLSLIPDFEHQVALYLTDIKTKGASFVLQRM